MKQDMKFTTREKRYETEEMAAILGYWKLRLAPLGEWDEWQKLSDDRFVDAVVARLRAADKLCGAAKLARESQGWDGNDPDEIRWPELYAKLRKAIADYEGKED